MARHDDHEAIHSVWLRPRAALEAYWRGEIALAPPQIMSLVHLARHASVAAMMAEARGRMPCVVRPHTFEIDGSRAMAYPGDALHPERVRAMPGPLRAWCCAASGWSRRAASTNSGIVTTFPAVPFTG